MIQEELEVALAKLTTQVVCKASSSFTVVKLAASHHNLCIIFVSDIKTNNCIQIRNTM
jgi:hypothetical protein